MLCYAIRDWKALVARCWDHLRPGGWLELQDIVMPVRCADSDVSSDVSPVLQVSALIREALIKLKEIDTMAGEKFVSLLQEQGFQRLQRESIRWAFGHWPQGEKEKEIGIIHMEGVVKASQAQ